MSDLPGSRPGEQPPGAISRPAIIAAVFLGLHVLPLFWLSGPFWGVDFLVYMPVPVQGAFILLSILLFIPEFRRQARAWVRCLPLSLWGRGRRVWITRILILLIALAAFVTLSSARHFLGDGYLLIQKLKSEALQDRPRAPLTFTVIRTLYSAGAPFWETAENTYRIYSYISGILYVLIAFVAASAIGKTTRDKSIVLAFLLTAGYMQLFFGYAENYALYMPGLLLYLLLGVRTLEDRMPLYAPALLLGVLLALHQAFVVFGPSLFYLAYHDFNKRRGVVRDWKNSVITIAALGCVPLSTTICLGLAGIGFEAYMSRMGGRDFQTLLEEPGIRAQYYTLSFAHAVDFFNQQILAAPAACMACFLLRKKELCHQRFLAICTVVTLFFTFLASTEIGAFRDWDIFSLPALPFTLWAAAAIVRCGRYRQSGSQGALVICGVAALHTTLWIGVNANAVAAETRFVHHLNRLTGMASVNGWLTLGEFHRGQNNIAEALHAYRRSIDADPTNPNRWMTVGIVYREIGRPATAVEYYEKAVELQPDLPVPYMNLGAAYNDMGQFDRAIEFTTRAIVLDPDLATAHSNLGAMYRKTGQFDKAIEHLERASELQPRDADTQLNLGAVYNDAGQHANAIEAMKNAVALRPDDSVAYGNLGAVYSKIGQFDSGIQYLKRAVELRPDYTQAHKNLGLVYRAQGRYQKAIGHFEKALKLQRENVNAAFYLDIGDTYGKLNEHDKAISYFQKAIQLNPIHANAHLLLGMSYRALNRGDRSRVHFEKTMQLDPDHPQSAQIRQWLGRTDEGR